jgi:carbamoyltransferase
MNVLGINAFAFNPSACLVCDGKLVSFCQEERLNRLKGSEGLFPSKAVQYCLRSRQLSIEDISHIAFGWDCKKYPFHMAGSLARAYLSQAGTRKYYAAPSASHRGGTWAAFEAFQMYLPGRIINRIRDTLHADGHKGKLPPVEFVQHHLAHAYQAFFQSSFDQAVVLVADGSGEEHCVSAYLMQAGRCTRLFQYDIPQSLGWYYNGFTAYFGFRANRDEGKLMGLAALGDARRHQNPWIERLDKVMRTTSEGFELDPTYFKFGGNSYHPRFTDALVKFITSFDSTLMPLAVDERCSVNGQTTHPYLADRYVDLAYAVQYHLEDALVSLVRRAVRETGVRRLCVAGGIFLNCKANGHLADEVDKLFVHPAAGDEGACLGAAFYLSEQLGYSPRNSLGNAQLGPAFSNDEIERTLKSAGIAYSRPDDICAAAAMLLRDHNVIGWLHAGLEMGPRALGGRSILALPDHMEMKVRVNERVKFRESWRPYAPSVAEEFSSHLFDSDEALPFMIVARQASPAMQELAPAVVHVDGTTRPQTVSARDLPRYHRLLKAVGDQTGAPILLNTSFNIRGEPIVCTPSDAIRTFYSTGLSALVVEDFLITKPAIGRDDCV